MLSDRFNPLRDDARADAMLALARSKAASPSQRACVAFAKQNIQAVRKREADTAKAREEYMQKVEQDYINESPVDALEVLKSLVPEPEPQPAAEA